MPAMHAMEGQGATCVRGARCQSTEAPTAAARPFSSRSLSFLPIFLSSFLSFLLSFLGRFLLSLPADNGPCGDEAQRPVDCFICSLVFFNTKKCSPSCTESKGWPRFLPWLPGFYRVFLGAFMFPANPKVESKRLPGFYGFLVVTGFFSTGFLARRFRVLCTSQSLASIRFPPITLPSFSLLGFWSALIHSFADWLIRSERTAKRTRTR